MDDVARIERETPGLLNSYESSVRDSLRKSLRKSTRKSMRKSRRQPPAEGQSTPIDSTPLRSSRHETPADDQYPTLGLTPSQRLQKNLADVQAETQSRPRSTPPKRLIEDKKPEQMPSAGEFCLEIQQQPKSSERTQRALQDTAHVAHAIEHGSEKERAVARSGMDEICNGLAAKGIIIEPGPAPPVKLDPPAQAPRSCDFPSIWDEMRAFERYCKHRRCFVVPRRRRSVLAVAKRFKQRKPHTPQWRSRLAKSPLWVCATQDDPEREKHEAQFFETAYKRLVDMGFKLPFVLPTDPVQMATLVCVMSQFVQTLLKQKGKQ